MYSAGGLIFFRIWSFFAGMDVFLVFRFIYLFIYFVSSFFCCCWFPSFFGLESIGSMANVCSLIADSHFGALGFY